MSNKTNLNTEELKTFLNYIISNNRHLQDQGKTPVTVAVEGEAGIGKTSTILQVAQENGLKCIRLNLATMEELADLIGFPVRQFQLCKKSEVTNIKPTKPAVKRKPKAKVEVSMPETPQYPAEPTLPEVEPVVKTMTVLKSVPSKKQVLENGKLVIKEIEETVYIKVSKEVPVEKTIQETVEVDEVVDVPATLETTGEYECLWVDENAVQEYIKRGYDFTGEKRMSYCPPEWIADKQGGGFLILDDWNRADIRFIQAVMELVDRQEYISWKLPKDWHILLTANPDNGNYLVQSIDTAQRTRFVSVNLKFDAEVWARWAENEKIDGRCINFLLMHPELVNERVNPRSITTFFNCISSLEDFSKNLPLVQMIGEGSVGSETSSLFTMFINNNLDKIISTEDMMTNPNEAYVVGALNSSVNQGGGFRADISSVIATRMINYCLVYSETKPVPDAMVNRVIKLTTGCDAFSDDLKYFIIKEIVNGNKVKWSKLMMNPAVVKMAVK